MISFPAGIAIIVLLVMISGQLTHIKDVLKDILKEIRSEK